MFSLMRLSLGFLLMTTAHQAHASIAASGDFCKKYPKSPYCEGMPAADCGVRHAAPPSLNPFGADIRNNLGGPLAEKLSDALNKLEGADSDGDGVSNLDEITSSGGQPGDKKVVPGVSVDLVYDHAMAFKRMKATYCGTSANYEDVKKVNGPDGKAYLHAELSKCLESDYWKKEALHRMADKKIQPLAATGHKGNVVIGDFRWDYWLFSYIMSGDRDVRELLSAQYHIDENGKKIEGKISRPELPQIFGGRIVLAGGQPLQPDRRLGMMTTQWFLAFFTMFSPLPRNTASQVYREYLGMDIAKGEGLMPIKNEPRDVDNKNIKQDGCAVCHSTLDPLSYAYSTYTGIETSVIEILTNASGNYDKDRQKWESEGYIFNEPVKDLREWAEKARNSDYFKKNVAKMIWTQALNRDPAAHEAREFEELWKKLPEDKYSVNKLVHRFVDSLAFGGRRP